MKLIIAVLLSALTNVFAADPGPQEVNRFLDSLVGTHLDVGDCPRVAISQWHEDEYNITSYFFFSGEGNGGFHDRLIIYPEEVSPGRYGEHSTSLRKLRLTGRELRYTLKASFLFKTSFTDVVFRRSLNGELAYFAYEAYTYKRNHLGKLERKVFDRQTCSR